MSKIKYLVCRIDAITNGGHTTIKNSCFPILVEIDTNMYGKDAYDAEYIVRKACNSISEGYLGMHEYVVVRMDDAKLVKFSRKPQPEYCVDVRDF